MSRAALSIAGAIAVLWLALAALPTTAANEDAREKARADLQSRDPLAREKASAVLGEQGGPGDLPLLTAALRDAAGPVRQAAEQAIWRIWSRSGDPATDRVFDAGLAQMQAGELREAVQTFSRVISMKPDFAEGWNKRATLYFLLGEYDKSLRDCDEVIKRNPAHFGVLAGYGQIHLRKGDLGTALDYLERALEINPNMDGVRSSIDAIDRALTEKRRRYI